jgi:2-polyprenyl-3-methyl-5-hydroxy-6-metoxy-1,4-benzoquinol methylase
VADISGPLLSFARWRFQQRALRAQIVDLKCDKLPENAYDIATAFDVLEHVPDPISVLRDLHRCLSPDGVLMLNLPGPEVGDRPMHYAHDENALLAEAAGMGFRQRRSRDRGLWLFEKFAR